jgi:hypothetical protein
MRKALCLVLGAMLLCACGSHRSAGKDEAPILNKVSEPGLGLSRTDKGEQYAPHTLIAYYDADIGKQYLLKAIKKKKCEVIYDYSIVNAVAFRVPDTMDILEAKKHFEGVKGVLGVERDRIYRLDGDVQ